MCRVIYNPPFSSLFLYMRSTYLTTIKSYEWINYWPILEKTAFTPVFLHTFSVHRHGNVFMEYEIIVSDRDVIIHSVSENLSSDRISIHGVDTVCRF